jgi:hypothetical protein
MKIELTIVTSTRGRLNKYISLSEAGELLKRPSPQMYEGVSKVIAINKMDDLENIINSIESNQALVLGVPVVDGTVLYDANIGSKNHIEKNQLSGFIQRSKEFFQYLDDKAALILFDIDGGKDTPEEAWKKLCEVDPSLTECGYTVSHSSSSYIYDENGAEIKGPGGLHFFVGVENGADILRYGKVFALKSWLHGYGHIGISKSGSLLKRHLIDDAVFTPERPVFEALPTLGPGVIQKKPPGSSSEGDLLKTESFNLSKSQQNEVDRLINRAKQECLPESKRLEDKYVEEKAIRISNEKNIPIKVAKREIRKSLSSDNLYGNLILKFDEMGSVTVNEVLDNQRLYHKQTLADPIEHDYGAGRNVAIFYSSSDSSMSPLIYSQAHGGKNYYLKRTKPKKRHQSALYFTQNRLVRRFIYNMKAFINFALADQGLDPETISKRILLGLTYEKNSWKEETAFGEFIANRGIKSLLHFTKVENVPKILAHGLIPRRYLEFEAIRIAIRPDFADDRTNDQRGHNLLSISFPDYLSFQRQRRKSKSSWAILLLNPKLIIHHKCGFEKTPSDSKHFDVDKGTNTAYALFGNTGLRTRLNLPRHFTTNPKSVVLELSVVPPSFINEIHVYNEKQHDRLFNLTSNVDAKIKVDKTFFQDRLDSSYWTDLL